MTKRTLVLKINKLNNLIHDINQLAEDPKESATRHTATASSYWKKLSECSQLAQDIDNFMGSDLTSRFQVTQVKTFEQITPENIFAGTQHETSTDANENDKINLEALRFKTQQLSMLMKDINSLYDQYAKERHVIKTIESFEINIGEYTEHIQSTKEAITTKSKQAMNHLVDMSELSPLQGKMRKKHVNAIKGLVQDVEVDQEVVKMSESSLQHAEYYLYELTKAYPDIDERFAKTQDKYWQKVNEAKDLAKNIDEEIYSKSEKFFQITEVSKIDSTAVQDNITKAVERAHAENRTETYEETIARLSTYYTADYAEEE